MYQLVTTHKFNKSLKRCEKRGYDLTLLQKVIDLLLETGKLPVKYRPHKLTGIIKTAGNVT